MAGRKGNSTLVTSYLLSISSVLFSRSVVSDSLWPHELQHARLPCPSSTPRAYSNSCSLSQWCHPTISSSVIPFSLCLQSFPASGSFPMSQFFASGGQRIGLSASSSILPMNIQDWFPWGWTGWISLQSKELSSVFSNTTVQKHQFFGAGMRWGGWITSLQDDILLSNRRNWMYKQVLKALITYLPRGSWPKLAHELKEYRNKYLLSDQGQALCWILLLSC